MKKTQHEDVLPQLDQSKVANPYVTDQKVTGTLFVGRVDILRQLDQLWASEAPMVVLYGARRMGKTSILHHLHNHFGAGTTVVIYRYGRVYINNTKELLFNLALALYNGLPRSLQEKLEEPLIKQYVDRNSYTAFRRFMKQVDHVRTTERILIAIDEFGYLEEAIDEGYLRASVLKLWHKLIQTYPWFAMILAEFHTLSEINKDHWKVDRVTTIPVGYLSPAAARQLIIQSNEDFALDVDVNAISEIIRLTNGQPYLIQLICRGLIKRYGSQTERHVTISDIDAIISAPDFYRNAHFAGTLASDHGPAAQLILNALAHWVRGLPINLITQRTQLSPETTKQALETLKEHDIVREQDGRWCFTVELMRRWVLQR